MPEVIRIWIGANYLTKKQGVVFTWPDIVFLNIGNRERGQVNFNSNFSPLRFIKYRRDLFKNVSLKKRDKIERIYDAAVYTFDFRFGEFIEFLKKEGIYDQSMIIFTSDHGEEFKDHGAWEHGHSLYNELIKIPLIIKFPWDRYAGKTVSQPVSIVDILPTICDFYDIKIRKKSHLEAISLLGVIHGEKNSKRIISAYVAPYSLANRIPEKIALISGKHKFIFNQKMTQEDLDFFITKPLSLSHEMFNIFNDPGERNNIISIDRKAVDHFFSYRKNLHYKKGKKGFLKELEEKLKTLGYF